MKVFALLFVVLVSSVALAQPTPPGCGVNRSCFVDRLTVGTAPASTLSGQGSFLSVYTNSFVSRTAATEVQWGNVSNAFFLFSAATGTHSYYYGTVSFDATLTALTFAKTPTATNGVTISGSGLNFTNNGGYISWNSVSVGSILTTSISAANAGTTPATSAHRIYVDNALGANDYVFHIGNAANAATLFRVDYEGDTVAAGTLSSGTGATACTLDGATGDATLPRVLGGTTTFPATLQSNTLDATVSPTVPAISLKAGVALTGGDLVLSVRDSADTDLCKVTVGGTLTCIDTVGPHAALKQFSEARNVASIAAGDCAADMTLGSLASVTFEAGDTCTVGFALDTTGGSTATVWTCWPSGAAQISLRVCCNQGATACDPANQTIFYNVSCPDGNCN